MTPELYNPPERKLPDYVDEILGFDVSVANHMLDRIAEGTPLATICKLDGAVSVGTFFKWVRECPPLAVAYHAMLQTAASVWIDEITLIADGDGKPADRALRVDTRIKMAGIVNTRFAERNYIELTGAQGSPISIHHNDALLTKEESRAQVAAWYAEFGLGAQPLRMSRVNA